MTNQEDMTLGSSENEVVQSGDVSMIKKIFKNRFGHVRAGWRMLIYVILSIALIMPTMKFLMTMNPEQTIISRWKLIGDLIMITITCLTAYIVLRWVDKRPFGLLGISFTPGWFRELKIGLIMGFGIMTLLFLIFWITGINEVSVGAMNFDVLKSLLGMMVLFFFAAIIEEIITRGYLLQSLAEGSRQMDSNGCI